MFTNTDLMFLKKKISEILKIFTSLLIIIIIIKKHQLFKNIQIYRKRTKPEILFIKFEKIHQI